MGLKGVLKLSLILVILSVVFAEPENSHDQDLIYESDPALNELEMRSPRVARSPRRRSRQRFVEDESLEEYRPRRRSRYNSRGRGVAKKPAVKPAVKPATAKKPHIISMEMDEPMSISEPDRK